MVVSPDTSASLERLRTDWPRLLRENVIKSSISRGDVLESARNVTVYREVTGEQPTRMVMIGPYVDERPRPIAAEFGIELVSAPSPPEI